MFFTVFPDDLLESRRYCRYFTAYSDKEISDVVTAVSINPSTGVHGDT